MSQDNKRQAKNTKLIIKLRRQKRNDNDMAKKEAIIKQNQRPTNTNSGKLRRREISNALADLNPTLHVVSLV